MNLRNLLKSTLVSSLILGTAAIGAQATPTQVPHQNKVDCIEISKPVVGYKNGWQQLICSLEKDVKIITAKMGFGCSSVRHGDFVGRNLDLPNFPGYKTTIVHTKKGRDIKYDSVAASLTPSNYLNNGEAIAAGSTDGVNEKGFAVTINVTQMSDAGKPSNINPNAPVKMLPQFMVRYLLDNAKDVNDALKLLDKINLKTKNIFHWLLSDAKGNSVVLETFHNSFIPIPCDRMTNFFITNLQSGHPIGVERMEIINKYLDNVHNESDMINLMSKIFYSQAYDINTGWYSEFYDGNPVTVYDDLDVRKANAEKEIAKYDAQPESKWYTSHTSIINLKNKTLKLITNEDLKHTKIYKI